MRSLGESREDSVKMELAVKMEREDKASVVQCLYLSFPAG